MSSPASLPSEFPRERTWLLPALQTAQRAEGWLSPDTLEAIAAHLRVPKSEVWGVASHYPELRLARPGRRIVRVCTGVSCRVRGGREVLAACERTLGAASRPVTSTRCSRRRLTPSIAPRRSSRRSPSPRDPRRGASRRS